MSWSSYGHRLKSSKFYCSSPKCSAEGDHHSHLLSIQHHMLPENPVSFIQYHCYHQHVLLQQLSWSAEQNHHHHHEFTVYHFENLPRLIFKIWIWYCLYSAVLGEVCVSFHCRSWCNWGSMLNGRKYRAKVRWINVLQHWQTRNSSSKPYMPCPQRPRRKKSIGAWSEET